MRTQNTSARDRRRARRAEARDKNENMSEVKLLATEKVKTELDNVEEVNVVENIGAEEASSDDEKHADDAILSDRKKVAEEPLKNHDENYGVEMNNEEMTNEYSTENVDSLAKNEEFKNEVKVLPENINKVENDIKAGNDEKSFENKVAMIPPIDTIYATAIISNVQECQVTSVHLQGLRSIFLSKDHLSRNVSNWNHGRHQVYRLNSGKYELALQLVIEVETTNLWESSRSYLFHHLGRDRWTLSDGSTIELARIHQKR